MTCRICNGDTFAVLDLGMHPLANKLLENPNQSYSTYPLRLDVCRECSNAQLSFCADEKELYGDYLYITPDNVALRNHYDFLMGVLQREHGVNRSTSVLEIGSNVGRFLDHISDAVASVLGVDPAQNICEIANKSGVPTLTGFFNKDLGKKIYESSGSKDLIVARHCFAHNARPQEMLDGALEVLSGEGILLIENAYFLDTVEKNEFDQVYHEHMYYYNTRSISKMLNLCGLELFDIRHGEIHGGSIVFLAKRLESDRPIMPSVKMFLEKETSMHSPEYYGRFVDTVNTNKSDLLNILQKLKQSGKTVHAYGTSAKSVTLLNFYGIDQNLIPISVDSTPTKIGKYIPKANLKIISEEESFKSPPDYYLLTSWNYKKQIMQKVRDAGIDETLFIIPHPQVEVLR